VSELTETSSCEKGCFLRIYDKEEKWRGQEEEMQESEKKNKIIKMGIM
jgi:hypothetical protein